MSAKLFATVYLFNLCLCSDVTDSDSDDPVSSRITGEMYEPGYRYDATYADDPDVGHRPTNETDSCCAEIYLRAPTPLSYDASGTFRAAIYVKLNLCTEFDNGTLECVPFYETRTNFSVGTDFDCSLNLPACFNLFRCYADGVEGRTKVCLFNKNVLDKVSEVDTLNRFRTSLFYGSTGPTRPTDSTDPSHPTHTTEKTRQVPNPTASSTVDLTTKPSEKEKGDNLLEIFDAKNLIYLLCGGGSLGVSVWIALKVSRCWCKARRKVRKLQIKNKSLQRQITETRGAQPDRNIPTDPV